MVAHKIKGNAALYELPELGELAAQLEAVLKERASAGEIRTPLSDFLDTVLEITQTGRKPAFGNLDPTCQMSEEEQLIGIPIHSAELARSITLSSTAKLSLGGKSALMVFAEPWFEEFLGTYFNGAVDLVFRASCAEAIPWLASNTPDIIVCESDLPDTPGVTFMKFMRANGALSRVPFLLRS